MQDVGTDECPRDEAVVMQRLAEKLELVRDREPPVVPDTVVQGVGPRQEADVGGKGQGRLADAPLEDDSFFGQAVDVRRVRPVSVRAHVVRA